MPFGISSASEVLQQRNDETFSNIPNVLVIADDIIIAGKDDEEHDEALRTVMERARQKNVRFSPSKLQFKNSFGDHLLGCNQQQNSIIKRHNALCELVFNAVLVDDSRCRREMKCNSTNEAGPGDIFHPDFERGLPTYFDLTVRNSLQPSYLVKRTSRPGAAAEAGEIEKDQRHDCMVSQTGSVFHPLMLETLGLWSPNSLKVIKVIARRASYHNNASISQSVCNLHQQLSVKLWLFNARMLLARLALESRGKYK